MIPNLSHILSLRAPQVCQWSGRSRSTSRRSTRATREEWKNVGSWSKRTGISWSICTEARSCRESRASVSKTSEWRWDWSSRSGWMCRQWGNSWKWWIRTAVIVLQAQALVQAPTLSHLRTTINDFNTHLSSPLLTFIHLAIIDRIKVRGIFPLLSRSLAMPQRYPLPFWEDHISKLGRSHRLWTH